MNYSLLEYCASWFFSLALSVLVAYLTTLLLEWSKNRLDIRKAKDFGRLNVWFRWLRGDSWCGRFGGGWLWALGVKCSRRSIVFDLLFCQLMLSWREKK